MNVASTLPGEGTLAVAGGDSGGGGATLGSVVDLLLGLGGVKGKSWVSVTAGHDGRRGSLVSALGPLDLVFYHRGSLTYSAGTVSLCP